MISGYIKLKTRKAENREIKTTIYNILKNTEAIGKTKIPKDLLIQRTGEHLEEIRLTYTHQRIEENLQEMIQNKIIYQKEDEVGLK